jgi:hypothetical protein
MAEEMERYLNHEIRNVPNIQGNIFFQYKRSEYMVAKSAEEWAHWNNPYYRYEIYQEQHRLLEHLHKKFGSDVLILYAAPAVQDVNELVDLHKTQGIVKNTNFRPAHELSGHHRNTFIEPGAHSWACSEPARLEPFNLEAALAQFKLAQTESRDMVVRISKLVSEVLLESFYENPFRALSSLYGVSELSDDAPLLKAYTTMVILREITGIQWVVVHRGDA